jgi:hypothetical protein
MDPKIIKGLVVVLAIAAQIYAGVPLTTETIIALLSAYGAGAVTVRRPGDLGPLTERGDQ